MTSQTFTTTSDRDGTAGVAHLARHLEARDVAGRETQAGDESRCVQRRGVTRRQTFAQCRAVYWREMKWYGSLYVVAMVVFSACPMTLLSRVPTAAPMPFEFSKDLLLHFLVGDFVSYLWHRFEHRNGWYVNSAHYYHHVDTPRLTLWTAMVVHPVEGFSVFACFHSYGIPFPIHPLAFAVGAFPSRP
jgi:sterol desaturase/sphingolipid hydroxylase (fatty acid hydroxylase superfamily)